MNVPDTMKAVFQNTAYGTLYTKEVAVPQPAKGQVLVKMHAAPINPSDLSMLQGTYTHTPDYPFVPGIEGAGEVIAAGGGLLPSLRKGKFVALSSQQGEFGTWAEYVVTSAMNCIPIPKTANKDLAAMTIVNPLTVACFMQIIKSKKTTAVISTAAASSLGKMLDAECKKIGVLVINIVRKKEQIDLLKQNGAQYVLDCTNEHFQNELADLSNKLDVLIAFDAVGGDVASVLIDSMPSKATYYSYAMLSEQNISVSPRTLLQKEIDVKGFYLMHYLKSMSLLKNLAMTKMAKRIVFGNAQPTVAGKYALTDAQLALESYKQNMSKGKVLLAM